MKSITSNSALQESYPAESQWSKGDAENVKVCKELCEKIGVVLTSALILVNITTQRLFLLKEMGLQRAYSISTAAKAAGQEEGSGKTPLGLHYIHSKFGKGEAPMAVFKSREPTGEIASQKAGGDAIVGRILWLSGLQEGINQGIHANGKVVDTYRRYIYIHGTNDTENVGKPLSAGCVRMLPSDVIDLFAKVSEGSLVHIYCLSSSVNEKGAEKISSG